MPDRMTHDAAFSIAFRVLELMRSSIPEHARQAAAEEFYPIAYQEVAHLLNALTQQEKRLRPLEDPAKDGEIKPSSIEIKPI
jgi:hypothetical protein